MRKLSKVLSILLAIVFVFSTASIGVEAAYNAYKDVEMSYDAIDQPILSVDQYASMAMDELDRMLMKEKITFKEEFIGIKIEGNFSTIDQTLDSISTIYTQFKGLLSRIGGDVEQLNFSALLNPETGALTCPKRTTQGKSDLDVFKAVFQFLADNAAIIAKVPKGSKSDSNPDGLDLGLVGGFVDLGEKLNVPKLVKEKVCAFVYPELDESEYNLNLTLDQYLSTLIDRVLNGTYPTNVSAAINRVSEVAQEYLPGLSSKVHFMTDPVYTVLEQGVRAVLDSDKAMDYINYTVQRWLHQLCGYKYIKSTGSDGHPVWTPAPGAEFSKDRKPEFEAMVNLDFNLTSFNTNTWGNDTFVDHLNDILGKIVLAAFNSNTGITWTNGSNENLLANIRGAVEVVLEYIGSDLFPDFFDDLPIEQVKAMNNDQFVAYLLRAIMNGSITSVYVDSSVNTTLGVLFETVKSLAADLVPSQNYSDYDRDEIADLTKIGLDIAAAGLKGVTSMDIPFGLDEFEFADEAWKWVKKNYGGFVSSFGDNENDGWAAASYVFFRIIPSNWLPLKADNSPRDDLYEILFDDIVGNLQDFNLTGVLALASKNPQSELNQNIVKVLLARLTSIVNYVIPGTFTSSSYTQLEDLLTPASLGSIIQGLLVGLNNRIDKLALPLLSIACSSLDLSTPEEFGYPYVSLEDSKLFNPSLEDTFYLYNGSSGINTAYSDKAGNGPYQDKLYEYKINNITAVTVGGDEVTVLTDLDTSPVGAVIKGGNRQIFKFEDIDAAMDSLLTVTIEYDVYGETGQKMTPTPLTATNYIYVSETVDDGSEDDKTPATNNTHVLLYKKGVYLSAPSKVGDIADLTVTMRRNVFKYASQHARQATASVTGVTLDSKLAALGVSGNTSWSVTTTKDGGSFDYKPYIVPASVASVELAEGKYKSTVDMKATKTESGNDVTWTKDQTIFVYEDYDLGSYLRSAVRSDRQQSSFGTGDYEAKYIPFDSLELVPTQGTKEEIDAAKEALMETVDVNGADAWERYVAAVTTAAEMVYAPRSVNTFQEVAEMFYEAAKELYEATQELDACSESSGAAGVKNALNNIIPDDREPVTDDQGNQMYDDEGNALMDSVPYYDPDHTFFGREDYVSYTYTRFKPERRRAESLISRWEDSLKGKDVEPISAVEAAYATHRLNLYASRLIRVRAYKEHLNEAIDRFTALYNAGKGDWSTETWDNFSTAYNFALTVSDDNAAPIGETYAGSENLKGDGLRQSKVNKARDYLIKTAKRLVEGSDEADVAALETLVNNNLEAFTSENENGEFLGAAYAAFVAAYNEATALIESGTATQEEVDELVQKLTKMVGRLNPVSFTSEDSLNPLLIQSSEEAEEQYLVGLSEDYVGALEDYITSLNGCSYEIVGNESNDEESTGATLIVYDEEGEVLATYKLVLYGEVTGEGQVDAYDVVIILGAARFDGVSEWQDFDSVDQFAESMAADVDHDGEISTNDAAELIASIAGLEHLNQRWTKDGDETIFYD